MPKLITRQLPNGPVSAPPKPASVVDRIAPMAFDADRGIRIMLYGRSGTGKTTLWGTFPGPILAIITSGGNEPGELRSIDTPELRSKVDQVALRDSSEMRDLVQYQARTNKYKTIVNDHATGFQDLVLKDILGLDEIPAQKSWGLATQQQYGQVTFQAKEYYREMLALTCNVVIIGHERVDNAEADAGGVLAPSVGIATTPSLAGWLNGAVDYICQTFIRNKVIQFKMKDARGKEIAKERRGDGVDYCCRTAPHDVYTTKFRVPKGTAIPKCIVDPDYDKLMAVIKGKK